MAYLELAKFVAGFSIMPHILRVSKVFYEPLGEM